MRNGQRIVALIPLRGGSKSIIGKNIKPFAGRPLCAWVLEAAARCRGVDEVWVSTESAQIATAVEDLGLGVRVLERPAELATDTASTESVMLHFAQQVPFDLLLTIQATSPLLETDHLERAIANFQADGLDSMLSAVRTRRFFWREDGTPLNYDPLNRPMRQAFAGCLMENGAFYLTTRPCLESTSNRLGGRIGLFEMMETAALEIDEPSDWQAVEALMVARRRPPLAYRLAALRVVVLDVDGTLTDGAMYYSPEGETLKRFDTRDGLGIRALQEQGIDIWMITGEASPIAAARARKLGISEVHLGIQDKAMLLRRLCTERGVALAEVGYVGDDLNDLASMTLAGVSACPSDASPQVRAATHWVLKAPGGHGAVREFADGVLAARL